MDLKKITHRHIWSTGALAVLCCLMLYVLASCSKVEPKEVVFEEKDKTILLYFASNNNLYQDAASNISKIIDGYIPSNGNIVLYCNNFDLSTRAMKDTLPLLVNVYKDAGGAKHIDTIYRFAYQNSCTKNAMKSVINITTTMCPAKEYGLVLWSHGTGWLPANYYTLYPSSSSDDEKRAAAFAPSGLKEAASRYARLQRNAPELVYERGGRSLLFPEPAGGVDPYAHMVKSFGSERGTEMSIFDIQEAIGDHFFDFIAIDACLMGGIEIAYQLRGCCNYFISSPAEILTDSFPYDTVIEDMFKADYSAVAKDVYDYYNAQSGDYHSVTIATVKCSALETVAAEAAKLFEAYRDDIPSLDVTAVQRYFRYNDHWFYDLKDFLDNLCGSSQTTAFSSALSSAVVAKYTTGQMIGLIIDPAKFSGLSCYINNPSDSGLDAYYQKYDWNTDAGMIVPTSSSED